jgi:hypothetical protein
MRRAVPAITESAADLKQHLQRERDGRKKPRRQMLYLLASEQAHTRQEAGGLPALLDLFVPPGKRPSLAPEVLVSIKQRLQHLTGCGS